MSKPFLTKVLIFFVIAVLTVSAFRIRLDNFFNPGRRTIDEVVFFQMGRQVMEEGLSGYNTISYGKYLQETEGRKLPAYFKQPLFKHPPVYTFLNAASFKLFGAQPITASYISILFGVLMIPLVYLLGMLLFDRKIGILSAFFFSIDPASIICSQKVWPDTTLAFFMVLAIYLFAYGLWRSKDSFFIFSGIVAGLALLTKYSGGLSIVIIMLYVVIHEPGLFRNRKFRWGIIIPFLMLLPWVFWNVSVYGLEFLSKHISSHGMDTSSAQRNILLIICFVIAAVLLFRIKTIMSGKASVSAEESVESEQNSNKKFYFLRRSLVLICGMLFVCILWKYICASLRLTNIPITYWMGGRFNEPFFYFGRLIEFSFLYFLSFASFFVYNEKRVNEGVILYLSSIIVLLFFLLWGNYQSRYILAAMPFLIIIGVSFWQELFEKCSFFRFKNYNLGLPGRIFLVFLLVYIFVKTSYLNFLVSYPHDMCYF